MYVYLLVFAYTADRSLYYLNQVVYLDHLFTELDLIYQEDQVGKAHNRKVRLVNLVLLQKP